MPCPTTRTQSGIHATFAGVALALVTPTRRQPIRLLAPAQAVSDADERFGGEAVDAGGPTGGDAARAGHHRCHRWSRW